MLQTHTLYTLPCPSLWGGGQRINNVIKHIHGDFSMYTWAALWLTPGRQGNRKGVDGAGEGGCRGDERWSVNIYHHGAWITGYSSTGMLNQKWQYRSEALSLKKRRKKKEKEKERNLQLSGVAKQLSKHTKVIQLTRDWKVNDYKGNGKLNGLLGCRERMSHRPCSHLFMSTASVPGTKPNALFSEWSFAKPDWRSVAYSTPNTMNYLVSVCKSESLTYFMATPCLQPNKS